MELKDYRERLDQIDSELIHLFCERMDTVRLIGEYKKEHGMPIHAPGREREILERVREASGELAPYAQTLFETLMYVSREYQKTLMG